MVIELRGVEFQNKGAELMLHAVLSKVKEKWPDTIFVMEHRGGSAPINKQRSVGVYTKLNKRIYGLNTAKLGFFVPKFIRRSFKFILPKEVDAVLDGSGFAFGDFWGEAKAGQRLADHIHKWKLHGKKIIVLPQAFGPFTEPALISKMETILNEADLIFARDKYSFDYLKTLKANQQHIFLKPDFTNLIKGLKPVDFNPDELEVAIIPNNKLLESSTFKDRDDYLNVLNRIVTKVQSLGRNPFFLIHEGAKDLQLAKDVNQKFGQDIPILKEDDPLKVKGIIGLSKAIITSRFHGLVSALSQAIPCLCIGWSHKYLALMEDYGFVEGLLSNEDLHSEEVERKIELVIKPDTAREISEKLHQAGKKQKELSEEMWEQVFSVLQG
ncbi:polysaccharide pyruvyl transferase family protein [Olivibacter sp. SDN3]|uniref:polysaccharide pyruvyl transferase family protein n=1 Tax=Olivibacter sp. SDN3 TaxID=2764720 RepID=UPI0016510656|nr:polysaccharide pyruvyl transferase family protein [Olivibacter sp. SDN3]QNL51626.1 polysaccharide pyruvyl transferase family protein [Olivibacter sp. SDN3]